MTLDKLTLKRYGSSEDKNPQKLSKKDIYDSMSNRKLSSGIVLQIQLHTVVPIEKYDLSYSFTYSNHEEKWTETDITGREHTSKCKSFEYSYMADRQDVSTSLKILIKFQILVSIQATPKEGQAIADLKRRSFAPRPT